MADTTHAKTGAARADTSTSGITNYLAARSWRENSTDQSSTYYYYPQGLTMTDTNTTGTGSHDIILGEKGVVRNVDHHSRIAIFDSRTGKYHTVLLVRPTASGVLGQFGSHVGGVVQIGNYLYAGDFPAAGAATQKIAVFDLTKIYAVNASSSCATKVGALSTVSPPFCGYGESWVLPVMNTYYLQNTDRTTPLPMLNGLGMDNYSTQWWAKMRAGLPCTARYTWTGQETCSLRVPGSRTQRPARASRPRLPPRTRSTWTATTLL